MLLKLKSRGADVEKLQKILLEGGFGNLKIDSFFGKETEIAVKNFQLKNGINADGVVNKLMRDMLGLEPTYLAYPLEVPNGYKEIIETFGDPLLDSYWLEYSDFCVTPKELNHVFTFENHKTNQHGFYCNKAMVITFQMVYREIVEKGLAPKLVSFDGCYNLRKIRGREKLSTHSWGIAVDHNARTNPLGAEPVIDKELVQCFKNHGFIWGGDFKNRKDGQHFQYANNY